MVHLCCKTTVASKELPDLEKHEDGGEGKVYGMVASSVNWAFVDGASIVGFWHLRTFRLHLAIVLCCAMLANALVRNTLSMAMVCMVNTTALAIEEAQQDLEAGINSSSIRQAMIPEACDAPELISSEYDVRMTPA